MGKAIGTHRIVCSTGKRIEKEWRKEFNIDLHSIKKLKEDLNPCEAETNKSSSESKNVMPNIKVGIHGAISRRIKSSPLLGNAKDVQDI